jgi:diacylglycerol kinase (ATP)
MPGLSLIVNPAAGHGRALALLPLATAVLDAAGADYQLTRSASLGHAAHLAGEAAGAGRAVVAVGGDGMTGALAGALAALPPASSGERTPFGIIPAGRGNDLARVLGIPADPAAAGRLLLSGSTRAIDLIGVSVPGRPEVIVAGSVYMGVPSVAGQIANATKLLRGPAVYTVAALRAVATWRPATFTIQGRESALEFAGYAVVAANSAYFGAGMKVAPSAVIDDGELDLILMRHGPKLTFVRCLSKIKDGAHIALDEVSVQREGDVTLTMDRALPVAADGETLPFAAPLPAGTPLRIRALPGALTVIAPPAAAPAV